MASVARKSSLKILKYHHLPIHLFFSLRSVSSFSPSCARFFPPLGTQPPIPVFLIPRPFFSPLLPRPTGRCTTRVREYIGYGTRARGTDCTPPREKPPPCVRHALIPPPPPTSPLETGLTTPKSIYLPG